MSEEINRIEEQTFTSSPTEENDNDYLGVNWNNIEDMMDLITFDTLVSQFWTSTRIPVSNDIQNWDNLDNATKEVVNRCFAELTTLDTLQSREGAESLIFSALTPHEEDVLNNIRFMESIHARSYSTIFTTFNTKEEVDEIFKWAKENPIVQKKIKLINDAYKTRDPLKCRVASVFLETFLFYSGFYVPLKLQDKLKSVLEIIKLIIRDESLHGAYIGYKFSLRFEKLSLEEQEDLKAWIYELLFNLYEVECEFIEEVYDEIGWTEDVKIFAQYNANKALHNLKLPSIFETTEADVNPVVMAGLKSETGNHDFFSQEGDGYLIGKAEVNKETDYENYLDIESLKAHWIQEMKEENELETYYID